MNEKELIRRALMGDKQAQEECTEKGIVLPCPCCGREPYTETFFDRKGWYAVVGCADCPIAIVTITCDSEEKAQQKALKDWNTRPAPPVGRCRECKCWRRNGSDWGSCSKWYTEDKVQAFMLEDDFCSNFKPREESR